MRRRIVDAARLAPSVHNTQPWNWQINGTTLELRADRERSLPVSDPHGRNLVISCGAALHHAIVAAAAARAETTVHRLPEGVDSDVIARLDLEPVADPPTLEALELLAAIRTRRTDRRRFTAWPVPDQMLRHLAEAGRSSGAAVLEITDPELRGDIEELLEEARRRQLADPKIADETEAWIDRSDADGIPATSLPRFEGASGERPSRFGSGLVPHGAEPILHGTDGLLVISTPDDEPLSWLRAGESLSAIWLRATANGLSLVPLTQVVEVEHTRAGLEELLPSRARVPQILARVGWQEIGRHSIPRTPRRSLAEVLRSEE